MIQKQTLQNKLDEVIAHFQATELVQSSVFLAGSLIRNAYLFGKVSVPKDLDMFTITKDECDRVCELAAPEWNIKNNSFGGNKLQHKEKPGLFIDLWAWEAGTVIEALGLTDFGINAIAYDPRKKEWTCHPRFLQDAESKVVEVLNYHKTPDIRLNYVRGVVLAKRLGFKVGATVPRKPLDSYQMGYLERKILLGEWKEDVVSEFQILGMV